MNVSECRENQSSTSQEFLLINDLKHIEVNSRMLGYFDDGNPHAPITILNNFGFGAGSGEGNRRLSKALTGEIENSRGMQDLRLKLPKAAKKIEKRVESLKGKYRIITSQSPECGLTLEELAGEFGDLMETLGIERYGAFGSSAGGEVAIILAAVRPENVIGLFLQGTMTRRTDMDQVAFWGLRIATLPPIEEAIVRTPPLEWVVRKLLLFGTKNDFDFNLADDLGKKQMLRDLEDGDAYSALKIAEGIGKNLGRYIKDVEAPIMGMDGAAARLVKIEKIREILDRFHKQYSTLQEKIANRKALSYQVGGITGVHGHTVLNTFPELLAVFLDHAVDYFGIE